MSAPPPLQTTRRASWARGTAAGVVVAAIVGFGGVTGGLTGIVTAIVLILVLSVAGLAVMGPRMPASRRRP